MIPEGLRRQGWLALVLATLGAYAGMVSMEWRNGTLRDGHVPETIAWYLLAFAAYLGMLFWSEKQGFSTRLMWGLAILFRVLLLFTSPTLSDDVYRYLWDGHVSVNGVSPYALPIDSPELDYLDHPVRAQANNTWMASPYLPAAQWVFTGVALIFPLKPIFMQLVMVLFDLGGAWLLARLLAAAELPAQRLLLYLWNPLVIVEIAHGAHLDAWMALLTLLAITTHFYPPFSRGRGWPASPLFLALATLTKILPVLLLPIFFWLWSWRQRLFYGLVTLGLLLPSGLRAGWGLTGDLTGRGLFGALRIYNAQWTFNSGLFHWLEVALGEPGFGPPSPLVKGVAAGLMAALSLILFWRARSARSPRAILRLMAVPFMAYVLLSPVVHPWYLLILLAFLPFLTPAPEESPRLWLATVPWVYLSGSAIFSYLTYLEPNNFLELEWVRLVEWIPTLLSSAVALVVLSRRKED
jgi:alpha-1,6-mannosyltransferase